GDVHDGVTRDHARLHRLLDPGVDRGDVLPRDPAADDLVAELVARTGLPRTEVDDHVRVLAGAAGLTYELLTEVLHVATRRLAVPDLWATDVRVDVELPLEAVDDDLEVQLAHPGDERLSGLLIGLDTERRVLLGEAL